MITKHIESDEVARLDEGSNPSDSSINQKTTPVGVVLCFMENLERYALRFGIKQRTRKIARGFLVAVLDSLKVKWNKIELPKQAKKLLKSLSLIIKDFI